MGRFIYADTIRVEFDDRVLLHLQTVISTKLRRKEPFSFTWKDDVSTGGGRTTVWVHPGCNLVYKYFGSRTPELNREWLEALMFTANSPTGLYVVPEPAEGAGSPEDVVTEESAT